MTADSEHEALLRLLQSGAAASALRRLLDTHGNAGVAVSAGPRDWASHGLRPDACNAIRKPDGDALARSLRWLEGANHHLLGWGSADYPPLLRRIASPPVMLFVGGDPALLWRPMLAIVGSRAATAGGCAHAANFARELTAAGLGIASGLAAGIDAAAHVATLQAGGVTVAVLGTGPDVAYPPRNRSLLAQIETVGAVVSEHPPGTQPLRPHFPSRNRILAGLSLGTLVIEAALQSGALITARQAADAGREVFAVPGSILNPMARGCHRLIREGATLVETSSEIVETLTPLVLDLMRALRGELEPTVPAMADATLVPAVESAGYNRLWAALGHDPTGMDELAERSGLTVAELSSMLLTLELEGRVASAHGRYSRVGR